MRTSRKHSNIILPLLLASALSQGNIAHAENLHASTNLYGQLGLNTVPSARMDETGTLRAGLSTLDPYAQAWIGLQLAEPLSVVLRQSAEDYGITEDPDRLYPGVDLKLRLLKESKSRPEIALGLQGATGHKRMAGEYLALSKRYKSFDFTGGLGWGRYGTAGHFSNPLKGLHSHFGRGRGADGEMPNAPENWFTGDTVGLFGGVEYFTPLSGLSVKLDYGADRYSAEKAALDYEQAAPWGLGLNYNPAEWVDLAIGTQGFDKIMARLSFQGNLKNWRDEAAQKRKTTPFRPYRTGLAIPAEMELAAKKDDQTLYDVRIDGRSAKGFIELDEAQATPQTLGLAATHIANHAGADIENITLTPTIMGLRGAQVSLNRRDLEAAKSRHDGSSDEIWHSASFTPHKGLRLPPITRGSRGTITKPYFILEGAGSLSEEDHGSLYRTSFITGFKGLSRENERPLFLGLLDWGAALRLNIKDNLGRVATLRPRVLLPVRSNEDRFAARTVGIENNYVSLTHSFRSDLHLSMLGGYLEEMYGGAGGEILFRPFKARWALGAESWLALKRDPETTLNLGFNGDHLLTGHIKGWYDIPHIDTTLHIKAGRYLAEDFGATLSLQKTFKNNVEMEGFVTVTDAADFDLFGGTTHAHSGLKLKIPLGGYKYAPDNSFINIKAAPFGRDTGQALNNPLPLYELTEKFSQRHMAQHWDKIAQ